MRNQLGAFAVAIVAILTGCDDGQMRPACNGAPAHDEAAARAATQGRLNAAKAAEQRWRTEADEAQKSAARFRSEGNESRARQAEIDVKTFRQRQATAASAMKEAEADSRNVQPQSPKTAQASAPARSSSCSG
jgi:hypothetical protein